MILSAVSTASVVVFWFSTVLALFCEEPGKFSAAAKAAFIAEPVPYGIAAIGVQMKKIPLKPYSLIAAVENAVRERTDTSAYMDIGKIDTA